MAARAASPPARRAACALAGLAALLAPAPAAAHSGSSTYSSVVVHDDRSVDYSLRAYAVDLGEPLGLDRAPTDAELRAGERRLLDYVLARIQVSADGRACARELRPAGEGLALDVDRNRLEELRFAFRCPPDARAVAIDYRLFFDLDSRHTGQLRTTYRGRTVTAELTPGLGHFEWTLGAPPPRGLTLTHFVVKGVEHIFTGYDHIAFLLALLLVAALRRQGGRWELRGLGSGVRHILGVVSAFTLAHSLTLIAAALDWITVSRQVVEVAIAASIVYVAAENLWLGDSRRRWLLAFGFGLVHGLGFAAMLRPLLPPRGVVLPLLAFNLGVEVGQVTLVAAVLPALHLAARRLRAASYRGRVVVLGSAALGMLGMLWLLERLFGVMTISRILP